MPPPAEGFASRLFLGPALRTQPDRRLVVLVREGYEAAFEEIVRRYGRPLGHYAASIVGGRSEDVLQDAFSKALPALRRDDAEIDLRPWLFRIVRNTALNDLRDCPPSPELLAETLAGGRNPAEELEQREQLTDLIRRLQALPEPQRAAIVMRELEGLGHEEIAAALGLTDGGARQAIYRARQALRDGAGMLLPLPLVRMLIDHGTEAAGAGAGGAIAAAGASAGGAGAGGALKLGVVAAVIAGSVGAGVAIQDQKGNDAAEARAVPTAHGRNALRAPAAQAPGPATVTIERTSRSGPGRRGSGPSRHRSGGPPPTIAASEVEQVAEHLGGSGEGPGRGHDGRAHRGGDDGERHGGRGDGLDMHGDSGPGGRGEHSGTHHDGGGDLASGTRQGGDGGGGSGGGEPTSPDGSGHDGSGSGDSGGDGSGSTGSDGDGGDSGGSSLSSGSDGGGREYESP